MQIAYSRGDYHPKHRSNAYNLTALKQDQKTDKGHDGRITRIDMQYTAIMRMFDTRLSFIKRCALVPARMAKSKMRRHGEPEPPHTTLCSTSGEQPWYTILGTP